MAIKLCVEGSQESLSTLPEDAALEGFWSRLDYMITRDFKCSKIIGQLLDTLKMMSAEDKTNLENTSIDFRMQDKQTTEKIFKFAKEGIAFVKTECNELKKVTDKWLRRADEEEDVRDWAKKVANDFKKRWNIKEMENLCDGKTSAGAKLLEDRTYKSLGFTVPAIQKLASEFKASCSGFLHDLRDIRGRLLSAGRDYQGGISGSGDAVITSSIDSRVQPLIAILNDAIDAYKFVDYFLFYTNKQI